MDQVKIGALIRSRRLEMGLTQLQLADIIGVSDKAVSKWERGLGAPDISVLRALSDALGVEVSTILSGGVKKNARSNGNINKLKFYVCQECGNLIFSTDGANVNCCGSRLEALTPKESDGSVNAELLDGEWFVTSSHEMTKSHYIRFVAFINGDTAVVKKLYPEWTLETYIPYLAHGTLLWCCSRDGLFYKEI